MSCQQLFASMASKFIVSLPSILRSEDTYEHVPLTDLLEALMLWPIGWLNAHGRVLTIESAKPSGCISSFLRGWRHTKTDLVAITPGECFCPDVHIGILNSLLQGRHVLPMFPMLIPQIFRIERS